MKREPIEAYRGTTRRYNSFQMANVCYESEVRELESYTSSLEHKLKIAEDALRKIECQGFWGHNNSVDSLVKILDENTKIAEQALSKLKEK